MPSYSLAWRLCQRAGPVRRGAVPGGTSELGAPPIRVKLEKTSHIRGSCAGGQGQGGTNYTAKEKEKHCCWPVGLDQFSAAPLTGMLKPTQTVTVYWITCHTIKEPPFYRCGHSLQPAQSVIEMHHIQYHHSPVVDHRTSQAESTKPVW